MLGGTLGALLLLITPEDLFSGVVPWLLLIATLAFAAGPALLRGLLASGRRLPDAVSLALLLLVSIYGGYFNGGLGIVLLALFALWGMSNIHQMNGLKNGLSFALSGVSVAIFAVAGLVEWYQAIAMMVASTAGGYAGAPLARMMPKQVLRSLIAAIGFGMSLVFFVRLF